jgi:hypothetical protein
MQKTRVEILENEIQTLKKTIERRAKEMYELALRHNAVLEWCTVIATHHELGNHDQVILCLDNLVANKHKHQQMQH